MFIKLELARVRKWVVKQQVPNNMPNLYHS